MASNKNREFNVLYTHQKIKKSKRWQDGLLRISPQGTRAILFDDKKSKLDTVYVKPEQVSVGEELESDRFLITIEEEKLTERTRNDNEVTNVRVEVPLQQQPRRQEVPLQQQPQPWEVPLQQQPQQQEVPLQQQHQQPQWHQQSYHLQQEVFQNQKRMLLKRKRTGFTVPRQACKKVATESEVLPSIAVTNLPGKPMDAIQQTSLFSASFKTRPDAELGTDVYSVYDGIGERNLYSVDGEMSNNKDGQSSEIDARPHSLPSYQTVANLQENMSTVTPEINDSFTPHCYSADIPKSDPQFICTPCFGNLDTSGTNLSQSDFPVERTDILTERVGCNTQNILQESSEDSPNSYNTNQSAIPAERRSASQILALLGKGKAKFKPPMKHPESELKVAEIETQLANNNEELSSSLLQATTKLPPFENSSPQEFGDDVDVMTLLGQANVDSSAVSCTNVSNEPSHESTDRMCAYGPEMLVKKECRHETAQGQSSVELAESPNTANLQRFGDFNAVTNTVEKDVEQESDFSSINNIVHQKQKSQSQGQDRDLDALNMSLESEGIDDCVSLENGSKNDRNKDDQDDRKLDNIHQGDWQIDSMNQASGNLDSGDQGDENQIDRNQIDRNQIDRNQIDRNQIDRNQIDRNQIDRNQVGSNQDYGNEDDRNKTERAQVNRNKDVGNQGDGNLVSMNQDDGIRAHENQEHRDQDSRNLDDRNHSERNMSDAIQNDKFQDGRDQDDRHQDDRNWDDGNQDGRDRDDENQEDRNQDKNQDDRNQDDRNQYDSNWNDGNQDDWIRDVGNQDGRDRDDGNQDKIKDDINQDDRNQDDSNWDDGNQDGRDRDNENQEDRNQDKNQDDRNQNDRNQYDSNWNDGNQDDWIRDVGNQDGRDRDDGNQDKIQDDINQDDRNQDDSNWDDGNRDGRDRDDGNQEDRNQGKNQDDRNQDDRNQDDSNWDDGNRDGRDRDDGNQEDRIQDKNQDDRNQDNWNQDDNNQANQSQDLSCSRVKSETCISSAVAYISVNTDVECSKIIVQSNTANEKNKAKNTVLSPVAQANKKAEQCVLQDKDSSQRDSDEVVKNFSNGTEYVSRPAPNTGTDTQIEKIVCTLCGALLLSAQVMCAECADQIAVGLESSWKSGSQITDTTQLSQELQDESAKEPMMQSEMQQVDDDGGYCVAPSDNSFCLISREESGKSIPHSESNIGDSPQYGTLSMDSIIAVNDQLVPGQDVDEGKRFEEFFEKTRMLKGGKCESLESKEQEITLRICNNQLEFVPMKTASRVVDEMSPFDETTFQLADKRTSTSCLLENQLHNAGRLHYPQRIIDDKLEVGNKVSSLIPTSSYESPLPNERSLAVVNEGKASLFDKENLHEEWLTRIERFTCPEVEDSSDSVVPEITALLPQIENQDLESFKEIDNRIEENKDSFHKVTNQSLSHQCTQKRKVDCDVGEQCVPVQRESLSEEDASIQDECDTPSDEEWLGKIKSSSSLLNDTTNSETRGYEVSPPCTYVPNRHSAVTNSRTADGSLSGKCSDALHYLPTKWKAVAKRYKNTTVSQNVERNHSDMQSSVISNNQTRTQDVLNTSEDHIDVLHTCQESHEVCGYPNRWQDATRKKLSDGGTPSLGCCLESTTPSLMPSSKASYSSRWIKDTSSGDTSEDTSSVLGRWRDSDGRNLFEIVNQSQSPTLQSQISNSERRHFSGRMEYLPWSEGQGGSPHLNMYEAETHYQGGLGSETAKQSRTPTFRCCEASDTCGGLRLGSSTASVTQRLSPRCWPMFPGYSQQYAALDESFGRQPESPEACDVIMEGNIHVDSSRCESVGLDHEWKLQSYFHEEHPSSGVQCLKQQSVDEFDGSHDLSLMLMPIDIPSGPYSLLHPPQLKRSLVDDVNIIRADEDTPRSSDKETNKKKMENYWNNPVSSGTVRRELDTRTIFQASARRETLSVSTKTRGTFRAPSLNLVEGLPFGREDHHPFLNGKHRNIFQLQEDESPSLHPWSGLGNKQPSCVMQRDIIESLTDDELAIPRPQRRIGTLYPSQAIGAGDDQLGSSVHEKTLYSGSVVHPEVDSDVKPRSNSPMYPSYQQRTSNNILHQQWTSDNILNPNSVQCLFPSPIPKDLPSAEDKPLTDAWRAELDNASKNESQGYLSTGNPSAYPTSDTKNKKLYRAADKTSYSGSCLRTPQRLLHLHPSESVETFGLQCKELTGSRTCFKDQKQSGPEQNLSLPSWLRRCNRSFQVCPADVYQSLDDSFEAGITSEESSQTRPNSPPFITRVPRQDTPYTPCMADGISSNHERREFTEGASSHHILASKQLSGQGRSFQTPMITVAGQSALSSGRSICGELFFPSADEVQGVASLKRQVQIPASFTSVAHYKQVFTSALNEHLNIVLFELSQRYHSAKDKADVQYLDASIQSGECPRVSNLPRCDHGNPTKMVCVKKDGANKGRFFYACSAPRANQCKFFLWANQFKGNPSNTSANSGLNRPTLTDPTTATMYFKSYNVHLYYGCEFQRRTSSYDKLMPGAPAWIRKHKQRMLDSAKKKLYLRLSRKESSSTYGKDDIWVISKDLTFDPRSTFLARSIFHGPSSNNDIEVQPLSGYSTSNWTSICTVHALLACNASSELTCLSNIQEYVNARTVPILQAVLNNSSEAPSVVQSKPSAFKSPAGPQSNFRQLDCSIQDIEKMATDMIERYKLNTDQAAALRRVSKMFQLTSAENSNTEPVTLIHGVFGAGKSFLLAVTVLFLNQLFELSDAQNPNAASQQLPWKLLIASTTNVAVDRILLGLLGLGFEDFIRVGSIKKIAKPVLPYSVHASDKKDSREIHDLYEMLKTDLTPTEKVDVRRSIERQRLGMNKDLLGSVRVVGVTCAACTFPCMSSLGFPVILLDECSQMTEPSSLLPIARFQCEKLVLVGDPKQLDPTIQGSEAAHGKGLEQTLFNRLIQLGYEPIMLRTQYRCHPEISSIANNLFYDQQLIDGVTAEDRPPLAPSLPTLCFYSVSNGQECCASDGSYYNDPEASFVIFLIETLVLLGVEPADIGVITLYKAQTVKINVLLQGSKLSTQNSLKAIQISTVDAFQGGEKGVIILSCVRTDYMGFADSDKRTNVALTRSKSHLFIVGNLRILSANSLWGKVIDKCKDSNSGIQSSRAFIKQWTPRMEEILQEQTKKGQNRSKRGTKTTNEEQAMRTIANDSLNTVDNSAPSSSQPRQTSPHYLTSISQVEASKTEEVKSERLHSWACTPHGSSPSYSPIPVMEESEGDTSLNEEPCFDIGDLQGILE